jgi:hypothetical protein
LIADLIESSRSEATGALPVRIHAKLSIIPALILVTASLLSVHTRAQQLVWSSSFETGFPGEEWLHYDNGSYSPDGSLPDGRVSAWTIVTAEGSVAPRDGDHMYKGWIIDSASENHRAYPGIHAEIPTPMVNTFWVYLDVDYSRMSSSDWVHFGTWGNAGSWALHTMAVRNQLIEFAHTQPFLGEYIGPLPREEFPLRQWVRFTVYAHYEGHQGFVQMWQDGVPMLRGNIPILNNHPGTELQRAHWGMYANPAMNHGVQYNDAITICTLTAPLDDLHTEPVCGGSRRPEPPRNLTIQ